MARIARIKHNAAIFHIIIKSISDINLFKNNKDKDCYLKFLKHYQSIYNFKVYCYCLMTNHAHFIIDVNGADISNIMHDVNARYVHVFNKKYSRQGPLLQNRFKSKIIDTNKYLITASAYIHRNPVDIPGYKNYPEKFKYSSLGIYLGLKKDTFKIIDEDFIMQLFHENIRKARRRYIKLVYRYNNNKFKEFIKFEGLLYKNSKKKTYYNSNRNIIIRNFNPNDVVKFVLFKFNIHSTDFENINSNLIFKAKSIAAVLLKGLCNLKHIDISNILNTVCESKVCKLCNTGVNIIQNNPTYNNIFWDFVKLHSA